MPSKNKTSKSISKRMKVTGTGKIKHATPGKRHLNAHMTAKRKRQLRQAGIVPKGLVKKYLIAMGEY
jgi:large subunit ribosomal protein L35